MPSVNCPKGHSSEVVGPGLQFMSVSKAHFSPPTSYGCCGWLNGCRLFCGSCWLWEWLPFTKQPLCSRFRARTCPYLVSVETRKAQDWLPGKGSGEGLQGSALSAGSVCPTLPQATLGPRVLRSRVGLSLEVGFSWTPRSRAVPGGH